MEWYKVKVEKETKTSDFLKKKVEEMSVRIKATKVDGRNILTKRCDGTAQS